MVDHYEEDWDRLGWVMLRSDATILEGGTEHGEAIRELRGRYPQYLEMTLEGAPLLRLEVTRANEWWASGAADR